MKVKVNYSDYVTSKGKKEVESYEATVGDSVTIKFEMIRPSKPIDIEDGGLVEVKPIASCKITMKDSSTLEVVNCEIPQDEYRDFLQIVKEIATQFNV